MSYYNDLTVEQQGQVLAAMAGLKLNAKSGKPITRADINAAFVQAVGKPLSLEYMRDPSVVQLMSLEGSGHAEASLRATQKANQFASTDSHLAARGLPVPPPSSTTIGSTRYSARVNTPMPSGGSRWGR